MAAEQRSAAEIRRIFRKLEAAMGRQHWWPAGSAFEVVMGAYLTQNTAWVNVEFAMRNLRTAGVLSVSGIRNTPLEELEQLVRPAGYFRQKAARLKRFVEHLDSSYEGSLEKMFARETEALREELLRLPGIGPETADSILLYAANREVFVVDTYTRRIFGRHGLAEDDTSYDEIRLTVQQALAKELDAGPGKALFTTPTFAPVTHTPSVASQAKRSEISRRYNEFHALIVQTAKHYCVKNTPKCESCPLRELLPSKLH
jgi:endonuclease-3 related protein